LQTPAIPTAKPRPLVPNGRLERIENFVARLASIPGVHRDNSYSNKVWSEAANELQYLKTRPTGRDGELSSPDGEASEPAGPRAGKYAISTIRAVLSDYREAIRADPRFGPSHVVLDYLRPSNADQLAEKATRRESVLDRSAPSRRRPVDAEKLTDMALDLLEAPESGRGVPLKTVALALLTGRRPGELLRGELSEANSEAGSLAAIGAPALHYEGPARTGEIVSYDIPVLADATRVLAAFQQLQREYPFVADLRATNPDVSDREIGAAINRKTATRLVGFANEYFSDERGELLSPVELRKAYVAIAFDWYVREQQPDTSFNSFAAQVLGHGETDATTALAYQQFEVMGQADEFSRAFLRANLESAAALEERAQTQTGRARDYSIEHAAAFRTAALREVQGRSDLAPDDLASEQLLTLVAAVHYTSASRQGTPLDEEERPRIAVSLSKGDTIMQTIDDEVAVAAPPESESPAVNGQVAEAPEPAPAQAPDQTAPPTAPAKRVSNSVQLTGTLKKKEPPRSPKAPARFDVLVGKTTLSVAAFREAAQSLEQQEIGSKVDVDGYLSISPRTTRSPETGQEQTRNISSVTANTVTAAEPDAPDRNEVTLRGNTGRKPFFEADRDGNDRRDYAVVSLAIGKRNDAVLFADVQAFGDAARTMRDSVGQGDALAIEGRAAFVPSKDPAFPGTVKIIANDEGGVEIERKKEPQLELTGRVTRQGAEIHSGEKQARVDFTIDTGADQGDDRYKKVRTWATLDDVNNWKNMLSPNTVVDVVGKAAVDEATDPAKPDFKYIKATSVMLHREQEQTQAAETLAATPATQTLDADDLADEAAAAVSATAPATAQTTEAPTVSESEQAREDARGVTVEVPPVVAQGIDVDALSELIAGTEWDAGPEAKSDTLAAITSAAQVDAIATGNLIEQFAQENGAEKDPAIAEIIGELKDAANKGVDLRLDAMMPKVEASSLPVFVPGPEDVVSDRSSKKLVVDRKVDVFAQSADGEKIFGRDLGGASKDVIAIDRSAFSKAPEAGEVLVSRKDGVDVAEPLASELSLGVAD
jgi:integrase/single-stranded DNA-binding protein